MSLPANPFLRSLYGIKGFAMKNGVEYCLPVTLIVQKAPGSVLLKLNPLSENDISGTTTIGCGEELTGYRAAFVDELWPGHGGDRAGPIG